MMCDRQKTMRIICLNPLVAYFSTENMQLIRFTNQFSNIKLKNLIMKKSGIGGSIAAQISADRSDIKNNFKTFFIIKNSYKQKMTYNFSNFT